MKTAKTNEQKYAQRFGILFLIVCIAIAAYTMYDVARHAV